MGTELVPVQNAIAFPDADVKETGPNGVHVTFPNGWTVSVQWGYANYCANRDLSGSPTKNWTAPAPPSPDAEIAVWRNGDDWVTWPDGAQVQGWMSKDEILRVLEYCRRDEILRRDGVARNCRS